MYICIRNHQNRCKKNVAPILMKCFLHMFSDSKEEKLSKTQVEKKKTETGPIYKGIYIYIYVSVNLLNQAICKLSENFRQLLKYLFQSVNLQIV